MYIEAVIISVGYSDFLAESLPLNRAHFDKLVVVTTPADTKTRRLCEHHHVECVVTDVFYENGDVFNKAKGINAGLDRLSKRGWVVHFDGDIVLPTQFRSTLDPLDLDPAVVYGVDRLMCTSYADWHRYKQEPHLTQEAGIYVHPHYSPMPVGTRIAKYGTADGYIPIGFFQLWHPVASGVHHYPETHGDAGRTDMLFAMQWPRRRRGFIPEIVTIHLESEVLLTMGANWKGRKTRPFGPELWEVPLPETPALPSTPGTAAAEPQTDECHGSNYGNCPVSDTGEPATAPESSGESPPGKEPSADLDPWKVLGWGLVLVAYGLLFSFLMGLA